MEAPAFEIYMNDVIGNGFLALSVCVGKEMGLYDEMCSLESPATIQQIADKTNLKERYVKEWLGSMVAGKIVEVDQDSRLYHIPDQYKDYLKSPMITMAPIMTLLANQYRKLKSCFTRQGPNGYDFRGYPEYYSWLESIREVMADDIVDKDMIPHYGDLIDKLTEGAIVADIGCGTGNICIAFAKRFPKSTFLGLDYGGEAIAKGRALVSKERITNVEFEQVDATDMPQSWGNRFDMAYAYDVVHDTSDPNKVLSEIHRILKADGIFSLVEIDMQSPHYENKGDPMAVMNYTFSMYSCLPNSLAVPPSAGLGACWGVDKIRPCLVQTGFKIVKEEQQTVEPNRHFICKKIVGGMA